MDLAAAVLIMVGLRVLVRPRPGDEGGLYGSAFAAAGVTRRMVARLNRTNPGRRLLLATSAGGRPLALLSPRELAHVLVVGPTRCGKGVHLTANLLDWGASALVIDLKGEFHRTTAGWRARLGRVVVLDPRGQGQPFDPLGHLGHDEQALHAAATIILRPDGDGTNSIFASTAVPVLVAMFRSAWLRKTSSLRHVDELMNLGFRGAVEELSRIDDAVVRRNLTAFLAGRVSEMSEMMWQDGRLLARQAWATLSDRLRPLLVSGVLAMTDATAGDPLTPAELWTDITTVYIRCPEQQAATLAPVLKLLSWSLIQARIEVADESDEDLVPLLLGLDETGVVPIPDLNHSIATMAGRGMTAMVYVQSLEQLSDVYGQHGADSIIGNCATQVYYPTAAPRTQRYVSEQSGRMSVPQVSRGESRSAAPLDRGAGTESETYGTRDRPLIAPDELRTMHEDNVVLLERRQPVILAARLRWMDHPVLRARAHSPVEPLPQLRRPVAEVDAAIPTPAATPSVQAPRRTGTSGPARTITLRVPESD